MRLVLMSFLAFVGCGSPNPPALGDPVLTKAQPRRGEVFFMRAMGTDPDGDLEGGTLSVEARGPGIVLSADTSISGLREGATEAELSAQLQFVGSLEAGPYRLELLLSDASGNEALPVSLPIRLR
ncbi:MAG: hypothetical protein HY791_29175 [Deltaproteobacteria bacterium]|nr:hypothetical protein [Deltaproteobacteria bacterium]